MLEFFTPPADTLNGMKETAELPGAAGLVGMTVAGRYRVEQLLAKGAMGVVYRATHVMLRRPMALKVVRPKLAASRTALHRLQREARAASRLSHPGIITIHDLGVSNGIVYFAMEYLDGDTVDQLIERDGRLTPKRSIRLAAEVCDALAVAHRNGVVHRDIKPPNIMVTSDGAGGERAKLLDFGVAVTANCDELSLLPGNRTMGTPKYLSPEQARGAEVDGRSDIYSLGVVLYEMLTGAAPFEHQDIEKLLRMHLKREPPPIRPRLSDLPCRDELERLVSRCLEKLPERRYQSAGELAAALRALRTDAAPSYLVPPVAPPRAVPPVVLGDTGLHDRPPRESRAAC